MTTCTLCNGRGTMIGGDDIRSCPKCHGRTLCGSCGRMVPTSDTSTLIGSAGPWHRCSACAERDAREYARATA